MIIRPICVATATLLAAFAAFAQSPPRLEFEVASVKPAPPITSLPAQIQAGKAHVGMSVDGARVDIGFMSLADLLTAAYRVKPYQISGPDWMRQERFDILAKLPEGASADQVPDMLQALLIDRFKLTVHRENKEHPVYALLVGKNGPKLKESAETPDGPAADATALAVPDGRGPGGRGPIVFGTPDGNMTVKQEGRGVVVTGGRGGMGAAKMSMGANGVMRMELSKVKMSALADMLTRFVDRPVVDMTGLTGNYDVPLEIPMEDLMNMARAMAPELGLAGPGRGGAIGPGPGGFGPGAGGAGPGGAAGPAAGGASDPSGGSIFAAVQQLGLKLDPRKAPVETIVVDHLEKAPTEN